MYSRTRDALIGRPLKPVFCGEYALIERKRPSDTLLSHGRRYPEFLRLVSWSALLAGASILPAEWNDGARFGEHVGRQADGQLLYDNFAELALIARFVHGDKGGAGDFPLDLRHAKEPITLPQVGGVAPLALSLHRNDGGTVEMIGWLPRALGEGAGTDVGTLSLPGLVRNSEYRGCFHRVPEGTLSPVRFVTDGCGQGLIDLPEYRHTVAFKLRLSEGM